MTSLDDLLDKNVKRIERKIDILEVSEGDTIRVHIFLLSPDREYLHALRERIHELLDDKAFFDVQVVGRPVVISIDDHIHEHGDVECYVENRGDIIHYLDKL